MKTSFSKTSSILLTLLLTLVMTHAQVKGGDKNAVKRFYINISETEKIATPNVIDDYMTSFAGVAKITQTSDKVLLIEAIRAGRTTITVICGDDIYRYHLTAFDGRGADEANTNNEFAAKGYIHLTARFDKVNRDQLLIEGKADTQEQLDDAVAIAKKYSDFVVLKAKLASDELEDTEVSSPEERDIEKTIEKIANVKGLRVKVKFEMRQRSTSITESATTGNPIVTSSNTTASGATTSTTAPLLPTDGGGREPEPVKGTLESSTVEQLEGVPAKIFLFGRVKDDLQRAQAIRVARTFCTLVVSFLTVDDPIQIRFQAWIMDVNLTKARRVGVNWPTSLSYRAFQGATTTGLGAATSVNPLSAGATSAGTIFRKMFNGGSDASPMQNITAGLNQNVDVAIQILEREGVSKILQAPTILVSNGQFGYFNSGGQVPIETSVLTNTGVTQDVTYRDYGVTMYVLPMNMERSEPNGLTSDVLNSDGSRSIPTYMETKTLINPIGRNNFLIPPEIDESVKMVDENGNIGVRVNISITDIDPSRAASSTGAPSFISKLSQTRAILRDNQPLVISGLYQKQFSDSQSKVPFFGDIPLIGGLFKDKNMANNDVREVVVVLKPTLVRMGSSSLETLMPLPKTKEVTEMTHDLDSGISNKTKGKNEPYKGNGSSKKKSSESGENGANNANSVEQVPLIDVTPATPKMKSAEEAPLIRRAEPVPLPESTPAVPQVIPESPATPEAPTPVNLQEESVVPAQPKAGEEDSQSPARMKEGPKTRVRPEAPDDSGLLKEQTKLRLLNSPQEVKNRP